MSQPIEAADVRTYVVNLRRRPDRRDWISRRLPAGLPVTFTSDWTGPFDGRSLTRELMESAGYRTFPWQIDSDNRWWNRPLKFGEVGCTLSHLDCWRHAAVNGSEPFIMVLEDDAMLGCSFLPDLLAGLRFLADHDGFDLLYLGRDPLEPDRPALPGFVRPGYSHCTYGYVLSRTALKVVLDAGLDQAIVPVDEFLPALYLDHPRPDLRARFPKQLVALAIDPPLVGQRPKAVAGSDTEATEFVPP